MLRVTLSRRWSGYSWQTIDLVFQPLKAHCLANIVIWRFLQAKIARQQMHWINNWKNYKRDIYSHFNRQFQSRWSPALPRRIMINNSHPACCWMSKGRGRGYKVSLMSDETPTPKPVKNSDIMPPANSWRRPSPRHWGTMVQNIRNPISTPHDMLRQDTTISPNITGDKSRH